MKACVWSICEALHRRRLCLLYTTATPFAPAHVAYMAACVLALDYAHDAWFYWTHRLLHHSWFYRHVHYIHHKCGAAAPHALPSALLLRRVERALP